MSFADEIPDDLGPCSIHGRMNCLECYDLDPSDIDDDGNILRRDRDAEVDAQPARRAACSHIASIVHRSGGKNAELDNWCGNCGAHLVRLSVDAPWSVS